MKHGAFALATYRRRVAALALAVAATAASGACADGGAKSGIASSFRVEVAPLPLSGLTNATYVVTVTDGAGARLYESTVSADRYGDGISAISFDAPCHPDAPQHRIALALDSLETVAGKLVSGVDFDNPAPLDAPVEVGRTCVAGDVVPVRFELAPARRTSTGFFDVAVEWDDLLCRARLACDADPDSKVVPVLVDPLTGEPGPTALLELACAAPPGDPVVLYMSTVLVRCGGQLFPVDVAAGPGLLDPPYDDPEADLLFQAAITRSQGAVGGYDVTSWQVALGLNPVALAALPACTVEAAATAARTAFPGDATP
ncbi:MAG: hypothetical protein KC635_29600, partial [Myxococcales bacterium]|nr:hypothetical protein [Myxococcales bacterium]